MPKDYFDKQHALKELIEDLQADKKNKNLSYGARSVISMAIVYLERADIYVKNISLLFSNEISEEEFHKKVKTDLKKIFFKKNNHK